MKVFKGYILKVFLVCVCEISESLNIAYLFCSSFSDGEAEEVQPDLQEAIAMVQSHPGARKARPHPHQGHHGNQPRHPPAGPGKGCSIQEMIILTIITIAVVRYRARFCTKS